jgi:hypothetical protein
MGSITRGLSNNITTGGVILPAGITNASVSAVTSFANASGGTLILLSTQTASASANISFTTGLNSTYDEYVIKGIQIHPATDDSYLTFQASTDGGSNYNTTTTSTCFKAFRSEAAGSTAGLNYEFGYRSDADQAQGTAYQRLHGDGGVGNDNDQAVSFELQLFNPSSTTYVKHYIIRTAAATAPNYFVESYVAGYFNTTSAINALDFKFSSGNIDDGIIKLYGVKKS